MKTLTKDSAQQIIGYDTEIRGDGLEHKTWPYECPICEHPMLFFKEVRNPTGEAKCQLCGKVSKAEDVQAIIDEREKAWQEKKDNRILRDLSFMGNGTIGRRKEEES